MHNLLLLFLYFNLTSFLGTDLLADLVDEFIQILASCGIVGMVAYIYHRFQTIRLFFKNFSGAKMFPFVSMMTLLLTSMVDCHFFNIGPVLFYSTMLAFVEKRLNK